MGTPKGFRFLNPVRYADGVAYIQLGKARNEGDSECIVDVADVDRVIALCHWSASTTRRNHKSQREYRYVAGQIGKRGRHIHLSRFITGAEAGTEVDHINGNTLDNRRANLRVVSRGENAQNLNHGHIDSASKIKNVAICPQTGKWKVTIFLRGKSYWFGRHSSLEDAAKIASMARRQLHSHCPENSMEAMS